MNELNTGLHELVQSEHRSGHVNANKGLVTDSIKTNQIPFAKYLKSVSLLKYITLLHSPYMSCLYI